MKAKLIAEQHQKEKKAKRERTIRQSKRETHPKSLYTYYAEQHQNGKEGKESKAWVVDSTIQTTRDTCQKFFRTAGTQTAQDPITAVFKSALILLT